MEDDAKLIQACLANDQRAWNQLIDRYGRLVYSIPARLGLAPADADDVFQVVWGIVLRRLETLRDESRLSAWLIRTTYRETWRRAKQVRRGPSLDDSPVDPPSLEEPTEEEVMRWERQQIVRRGLRELDERCRDLLTALFLEKDAPSYEAIAERMGMKIGSIGPTRARCFKALERILGRLGM